MSLDELLIQAATFTGHTLSELQIQPAGDYEITMGELTRTFRLENGISILVFIANKRGWQDKEGIPGSITFVLFTNNGLRNINEYKMMDDGLINEEAANLFNKEFAIITQHPDWVKCEICGEFVPDHEAAQSGFAGSVCRNCLAKGNKTQPIDTMGD